MTFTKMDEPFEIWLAPIIICVVGFVRVWGWVPCSSFDIGQCSKLSKKLKLNLKCTGCTDNAQKKELPFSWKAQKTWICHLQKKSEILEFEFMPQCLSMIWVLILLYIYQLWKQFKFLVRCWSSVCNFVWINQLGVTPDSKLFWEFNKVTRSKSSRQFTTDRKRILCLVWTITDFNLGKTLSSKNQKYLYSRRQVYNFNLNAKTKQILREGNQDKHHSLQKVLFIVLETEHISH